MGFISAIICGWCVGKIIRKVLDTLEKPKIVYIPVAYQEPADIEISEKEKEIAINTDRYLNNY
ncbi:MAG: hypothetical protein IKL08_01720 [Clostridia bacterium]|nr:hypothetical protein [Clostridia bacterium]